MKCSVSLENFNLDLQNSPRKTRPWGAACLKFEFSLEISIPEGDLEDFQSVGPQGNPHSSRSGLEPQSQCDYLIFRLMHHHMGTFLASGCQETQRERRKTDDKDEKEEKSTKQDCSSKYSSKIFDEHVLHFSTKTRGKDGLSGVGCAQMVMRQPIFDLSHGGILETAFQVSRPFRKLRSEEGRR